MSLADLQEELRASQERYRFFVEQTAEGFYRLESEVPIPVTASLDEQVTLMYRHLFLAECNTYYARMHGASRPEDLIGQRLVDLHQGPSEPTNRAALASFVRGGYRVVDALTQESVSAGDALYLLNNAVGIVEHGQLLGIWGTQRDATERRRAELEHRAFEESVRRTQRLESLGLLAGGIAHDFNNLLTVVLGGASLAKLELPPEAPARALIDAIIRSAERGADLCRQLRAYAGGGPTTTRPIDLNTVLEELLSLLEISIPKWVEVRCEVHPNLPTLLADSTQLQQVIMNLVTNAVEAIGEESGEITVRTDVSRDGSTISLEVADNGCGIESDILEEIFDPFFSTKTTTEGRGLGLSAVRGIVKAHAGTIEFETTPGAGTTVTARFPASDLPVEVPREKADAMTWVGSGLALIVDDESDVRAMAKSCLERLGFETLTAADGLEGLGAFSKRPDEISLVLVDLSMPRMNGAQVVRELRLHRPDVPIVLSSGYDSGVALQELLDQENVVFLQKPYLLTDLVAKIRAAQVS